MDRRASGHPVRPPESDEFATRRCIPWKWLCATTAVLAGLWALDVVVLRTGLLATAGNRPALTPLYAFWSPLARPAAVLFLVYAAVVVLLAPRLTDPTRTSAKAFAAGLAATGAICALALFLVRMHFESLGANFDIYRGEEFWHDARRVGDARAFLAHYVELMPELSTHGRHFPPGNALLLACWSSVFGPSTFAAGMLVLICAVAALPVVYVALRELAVERAARQGALLVALAPSFLDFACTAMDAVFLLVAALALWLGLRAFGPRGRAIDAVAAGLALFAATFFSFSALPLGLALAIYAVLARRATSWRPLAIAGTTFAASALVLWSASGFALWDCFFAAHEHARDFMTRIRGEHPRTEAWRIFGGNAVAFAIGAGVPLVAACATRLLGCLRRRALPRDAWTRAATIALVLMCALYWLETERVWLFALPWIAAVALVGEDARSSAGFEDGTLRRLAALALVQSFAVEALLFTLW